MPSNLYAFEETEGRTLFVVDFRELEGSELVARFEEVAAYVRTQPLNSLLSLTLAQGVEYSASSMKAGIALARNNGPFMKRSAIVGLDHLTGLINIINRVTGRSIRAFHDEDVAREWLFQHD